HQAALPRHELPGPQDRVDRRQGRHRLCNQRRRRHLDPAEHRLAAPRLRARVPHRAAGSRRRRLRHDDPHRGRRRDLDDDAGRRGRQAARERARHRRGARRRQPLRPQLRRPRSRLAGRRVRRRAREPGRRPDVAPADHTGGEHALRRAFQRCAARDRGRPRLGHPAHRERRRHVDAGSAADPGPLAVRRVRARAAGLDRRRSGHGAEDRRRRRLLDGRAAAAPARRQLDPLRLARPRRPRTRRRLGRPRLPRRGLERETARPPCRACDEDFMIPKRWIAAYLRFLLRNRLAVTIVTAVMTIFFAYQCTHIKVLPQFLDFYPGPLKLTILGKEVTLREGHPYIKIYNEFPKMFGSANILTLVIEAKHGDIYNPTTLQKIDQATKALVETKGVVPYQILSIAHPKMKSITNAQGAIQIREVYYPTVPKTMEDAQRVKFAVYSTKGIRGIYVSEDDTAALVTAGFWEEEIDFNYLYDRMMSLKKQLEDDNHTVYISGFPWLYTSIQRYVPEVGQVFVITIAALTFLLWNYFRSWPGVWVPIFSGILSSIWALGMVPLLGLNLDPLVLVIPVFLSARALSHSVQSMDRYHEEYHRTGDKHVAIVESYSHLFPPAIASVLSDGIGI